MFASADILRPKYEIIDHTADIAIRTSGESLAEAFGNAAWAMFDIMADASAVKPVGEVKVGVEAKDLGQLLVDWLSELLFLVDVEDVLFSEFDVDINGLNLQAVVRGEKIDPARHGLKTDIKAVTYHMLEVDDQKNIVQVLFDL
jgi:SHS2 domain-containing protein